MKQSVNKFIKVLLPVLFILYYGDIALFTHVHIENGVTIVHSHPFKKAADGSSHEHASLSEIQLYQGLSSIQVADGAVASLSLKHYSQQLSEIKAKPVYPDYVASPRSNHSLRAPPVLG